MAGVEKKGDSSGRPITKEKPNIDLEVLIVKKTCEKRGTHGGNEAASIPPGRSTSFPLWTTIDSGGHTMQRAR